MPRSSFCFMGGCEIEVGEGYSAGVSGSEIEQECADDGVVSQFQLVPVFEDEHSGLPRRLGRNCGQIGLVGGVRRGNGVDWRDVGLFARSATIEDGGPALVINVSVIVGVGILIRSAGVDGIGIGNSVSISHGRTGVAGVVMVTAALTRRWDRAVKSDT